MNNQVIREHRKNHEAIMEGRAEEAKKAILESLEGYLNPA